jgi:hypothetical protein
VFPLPDHGLLVLSSALADLGWAYFDGCPVQHAVAAVDSLPHADGARSAAVIVVSMLRPLRCSR